MIMDEGFVGPIKPTDLKIYYEDSTPKAVQLNFYGTKVLQKQIMVR